MTISELIAYLEEIRKETGDDFPCKITSPYDLFDYPLTRKNITVDSVDITFSPPDISIRK